MEIKVIYLDQQNIVILHVSTASQSLRTCSPGEAYHLVHFRLVP